MASMVGVADGCGVRLVLGSGPFEADFSAAEGAVAYCLDFDFHSWPYGASDCDQRSRLPDVIPWNHFKCLPFSPILRR